MGYRKDSAHKEDCRIFDDARMVAGEVMGVIMSFMGGREEDLWGPWLDRFRIQINLIMTSASPTLGL